MWFPSGQALDWAVILKYSHPCVSPSCGFVSGGLGWKKKPKQNKMESCFSGFAFPSLCSGIKPKCDQTKPQTMSIYKGKSAAHALYWSFVCFLCRTSNSSLCLCMHPYVCLWLNVCVFVSICLGRREGAKMKGEDWSGAVLVLAGWWGGKCQKASLDSREEAVNSSSPGNLLDLNTDMPLIRV